MIIVAIIFYVIAVGMAFVGTSWSVVAAYAGMAIMSSGTFATVGTGNLVFWAIASVIVIVISLLQPGNSPLKAVKVQGTAYVVTATLAGTLVGMLIGEAGMIVGAAVGAFLGALAFSRTPRGAELQFPSSQFVQYLAARGLPAIVTMCMLGLGIALLLEDSNLQQL